jgi:restriction system protein
MDIYLEKEISKVRVVDSQRNYWFIRSFGGELYNDFIEKSYVGLGFNQIPYEYIREAKRDDEATFIRLQKSIESNTDYSKGEATKWANQLITFEHQVGIDDIVLVPSKSSETIAVGIIQDKSYFEPVSGSFLYNQKLEPYPAKRKRVKWLKFLTKEELRGDLKGLTASHQAITDAYKYADVIEGNLSTVYIRDEQVHLTIKIDQDEDINAFELQRFLESLTYLYKEFCIEHGDQADEELYIKIKVQSKGGMYLKAFSVAALVSIATLITLSDNSEVELSLGKEFTVKGKTDGWLASYSNFLDRDQKRKIEMQKFLDSKEKLKAKPIQDSVTTKQDSIDTKDSLDSKGK